MWTAGEIEAFPVDQGGSLEKPSGKPLCNLKAQIIVRNRKSGTK